MQSLNRTELIGRLGRDPEMRYTPDGQALTKFSLATNRPARAGAEPETDWHQIVCWGKLAEFAGQYLDKGRLVYVAGRLTYRTWEGQDGQKRRATEIVAGEIVLLDRRPETETREDGGDSDDDLPFSTAAFLPALVEPRPPGLPTRPAPARGECREPCPGAGIGSRAEGAVPPTPDHLPAARRPAGDPGRPAASRVGRANHPITRAESEDGLRSRHFRRSHVQRE